MYDVSENKGKIWVHVRNTPLSPSHIGLSRIDVCSVFVQLRIKTVNIECFFLFTFGTGDDQNLITNVTQFVGNKVFSGGNGDGGGGGSSSVQPKTQPNQPNQPNAQPNSQLNAQPSAQPSAQPETPFQALSSSVQNCIKAMGRCYVDILLFVPRNVKYVLNTAGY